MDKYTQEEKDWRALFLKLNVILCFVITGLEFVIFLVLKSSNKIEQPLPEYLRDYFFLPSVENFAFMIAGFLTAKFAKTDKVANAAPILALTFMFGNVTLVHHIFFVIMLIFAIPIFMTVFFGSKRLLFITSAISVGFLLFLSPYCSLTHSNTAKTAYFLPSLIIAIAAIISSTRIANNLITVLRAQNDKLIQAAEEARASEEKAIEASKAKSQFLSMASHEIRTPMNAVVGMTDLLLKGDDLTEMQRNYLENIKVSGTSLVMIVNDILDQSKIEAGKMEIVEEPYDIRSLLENIRLIIENRIGEKPIELIYDVDERITKQMVGDGLRIRQILINLMNNSVKFTEKGYIKVTIQIVGEEDGIALVRFGISDTGQGIKQEDLNRLFQAFAQVDTKKNHGKEGTGLGLSISANFIELMGGHLEVASEYGKGSEFYFTIKQRMVESAEDIDAAGVERAFIAPDAKVLVVDDTSVNLVVAGGLMGTLGIKIDRAESGARALDMIRKKDYDLVFMDYLMPNLNGVETTEKLRRLEQKFREDGDLEKADHLKNLTVIALTGDTSEEARKLFESVGMKDYLEKPLDFDQLKKIIKKWLPENLIVDK